MPRVRTDELNSRCLVTGGTGGLGTAVCRALARPGDAVAVGYHTRRREAELLAGELDRSGAAAFSLYLDVTEPSQIQAAVALATHRMGGLDVLVNGAAQNADGLLGDLDPAAIARVYAVNVAGAMHCIQAALPGLLLSGRGRIINFSSVLAARSSSGTSIYAGTKGAIEALTRAIAVELGPKGVRVNAVAPGYVNAGLGRRPLEAIGERIRTLVPARRPGTAEEIAAVVAFLVSEGAAYVNGAVIPVDGGLLAGSRSQAGPPAPVAEARGSRRP
jgi:3-oxoacyl-[acyl-carrier protein] reductase